MRLQKLKSKTATSCPARKYFCGVAQMSLRASITCPSFFVANKSNIQTPVSPSRRRCLHRTLVSLSRPACTIPWSLHCICIVSLLGDRAASKLPSRLPARPPAGRSIGQVRRRADGQLRRRGGVALRGREAGASGGRRGDKDARAG